MSTITYPVVFADVFPRAKLRSATLVIGFALFTALMAQVSIPLGFTPIPVTGQTLAVLLAGSVLGSRLGALSILLYAIAGLFLPFYAGGNQGWDVIVGASGGYIVGMVIAAYAVGLLAERAQDRTLRTAVPTMILGSAIIFAIGVPWLAVVANLNFEEAISKGVTPFLLGGAIKALLAGVLLPAAWKLTK